MSKFSKNLESVLSSPFTVNATELQLDPGILTKTSLIQLLYGAWVNMAQLANGLAIGFASILIPMLSKPDSVIQITVVDASWIVSAVPLLAPVGCVISGFVMDWAGRRRTLILCQVPMFVGWLYTALANTTNHIMIARAITGVGCGMTMGPSRAYGTEISLPNMRGVIGAFPNLAVSLGITLTAALGKFFTWQYVCYICCALTFLNFCSFIMLPETPYFVLQTKTEAEAQANLALFRGKDYNVQNEMAQLIDFKKENNLRTLSLKGTLRKLISKESCKPFMLMMIYGLIAQAAGISIILYWTIDLLQIKYFIKHYFMKIWSRSDDGAERQSRELLNDLQQLPGFDDEDEERNSSIIVSRSVVIAAITWIFLVYTTSYHNITPVCSEGVFRCKTKSSFDVHTGNILLGVTRVLMGVVSSLLLYKYGRKPLAMLSAFGVTIVCCAFGLTLKAKDTPSPTPQICLMVYVVFASLGYYTLPFLMAFELYPLQVRGILGGATISITSLLVFVTTKLEPSMLDNLGVANTFIAFGFFSFIGCIFIFFWLPETKDLTLPEIEEYYKDMRPTLLSQRRLQSLNQLSELSRTSRPSKKHKEELERLNRESSRNNMLARLEAQKKLSQLIGKEIEEQLKLSASNIRESTQNKEEDSKKVRGVTFDEIQDKNKDNESINSTKLTDSDKSALIVIYDEKKKKKKKDKDTPKDEKKDKDTPKDQNRDEETPKDEDQPSTSKKNK